MRMKLAPFARGLAVGVTLVAAAGSAPRSAAQNPDTMMPEQSEAKGTQILRELVQGLGGPGSTEVRFLATAAISPVTSISTISAITLTKRAPNTLATAATQFFCL